MIGELAQFAVKSGVRLLVLLSGRGEEGALRGEKAAQDSGAEWTILRSTWFNQNFSEGASSCAAVVADAAAGWEGRRLARGALGRRERRWLKPSPPHCGAAADDLY